MMDPRNSVNIVLLGKTGTGKSSTGNTILGRDVFRSESSLNSVTERSCTESTQIGGRTVSVVDTPGFYETTLPEKLLAEELARSVYLSTPGVHAFLYMVPVNQRFTQQEAEAAQQLLKVYGKDVLKYTIILFTHGDNTPVNLSDQILRNEHLSKFVQQCGGRYQVLNNNERENREQVAQLLEMIDRMLIQNGGGFYTSELFRRANSSTWAEFWEGLKEYFLAAVKAILIHFCSAITSGTARQSVSAFQCAAMITLSAGHSSVQGN